jgi:anti-anti-sigma factor
VHEHRAELTDSWKSAGGESGRIVSGMYGPTASAQERAGHFGFVYPTVQVRDDTVMAFVGAGLKLGERVVLASEDQRWESALAQHGVDSRRAAEDGSLTILDAPHFFPAQGQAALVDSLVGSDGTRVRLVTSAEGALAYLGGSGFRRVEREMDDLCETRPVKLLCHLRSGTGWGEPLAPTLDTFVDTHAHELRCRLVTMHRAAGGVRLRGEVDVASVSLVETVLARAGEDDGAAGRPGHEAVLVVDLSELDFLDVAGYRALRSGTEQWRRRGGTVLLTGASVAVRRVLELVGLGADGDVRLA